MYELVVMTNKISFGFSISHMWKKLRRDATEYYLREIENYLKIKIVREIMHRLQENTCVTKRDVIKYYLYINY